MCFFCCINWWLKTKYEILNFFDLIFVVVAITKEKMPACLFFWMGQQRKSKQRNLVLGFYSCNKIAMTQIQFSRQNWNDLSSNVSHQIMIWLSPIVSKSKSKGYKWQKMKKFALNSQLQPYQILTNDDQMLILCLSYFITTVWCLLILSTNPFYLCTYYLSVKY